MVLFHDLSLAAESADSSHAIPARASHWDLMLEWEGALLTWALESEPFVNSFTLAVQLPIHRIDYLEYEGALSGGRGKVSRIRQGFYRIESEREEPSRLEILALPQILIQGMFRITFHFDGLEKHAVFEHRKAETWEIRFDQLVD